jgi:spore germination protein GerM
VRRLVPLLGALALISVLSGCSVATQDTATPLPSRLILGSTTTTTTTIPASQPTHQLEVYFLKDGRLFPVVEDYSTDPLSQALEALGGGPTVYDSNRYGITTALDSQSQIRSAGPISKSGVALIEVDSGFYTLPGESLEEAFAQVVFTVTGLPNGPSSVEFLYNGSHLDALIPPAQLVKRAVTRTDYCTFAPLSYIPCQKSTGSTGIT